MMVNRVEQGGQQPATAGPPDEILLADTVTKLGPDHRQKVLLSGSHGGGYAGYLPAKAACRAVILNDAGIGRDNAGIGALTDLDAIGMAAATVAHSSARIGDAQDMWQRGIISTINRTAADLGCQTGQSAAACAELLRQAPIAENPPKTYSEARFALYQSSDDIKVWGVDSASLVTKRDEGHIIVTGSHGGLLGGDPALAIKADVLACIFNDAGIGIDDAGTTRLPALNGRGIAAATVDAFSARIGDCRSAWADGRISRTNDLAAAAGVCLGMSCRDFVDAILRQTR